MYRRKDTDRNMLVECEVH